MLLCYGSHVFIFQVNQQRNHFQSRLRALLNAFAAAIAFCRVNNNVILA
jgi:hypothetical protein